MAESTKTRKYVTRALVLTGVFLAAFIGYFAWSFLNTERSFTEYTTMEEPTLPVVFTSVYGTEINAMHGYLQDMGNEAAADCITVLPQNRNLELRIAAYDNAISNISYEIRSLDLSHFIENTSIDEFQTQDDNLYVTLPIQNLIEKDTQYLLSVHLDTGERTINYYTRIVWTDSDTARQMIGFAEDFARKTFDYEEARGLATYLETSDLADNSDLGCVTIESSFSQLTWANTGMQLATDIEITLKQYDGIMGAVELHYMTTRQNELDSTERYQVTDEFTMRMGAERIYLMDYERTVHQLFEGNKALFSGDRIQLGITTPELLQAEKSPNEQYVAYTADRELWMYDQSRKRAVNIFSFRSGLDDGVRANYDRHNIRILSVDDNGDVDFAVYGYMNRGRHEGYNGIAYYRYSRADDTITESFFIPEARTYEKIALELEELCIKGANDMLYLKQNDAFIAIDLKSLEMLDVASGLTDGCYAVSQDQTKVAWEDGTIYSSDKIKLMDITDGTTQTIAASAGEVLRVLGFMEQDLVYGTAKRGDEWILSNCVKGLPAYRLDIVSDTLEVRKTYQKESLYINEATVNESRIHLKLVRKDEAAADRNHTYLEDSEDTIVYQSELSQNNFRHIGSVDSEDRKKIYFVSLDKEIKTTRNLRVSVPRKISYENTGTIELAGRPQTGQMTFYAYAKGRLLGRAVTLEKAIALCYEGLGWVTDGSGAILYNRTDRDASGNISYPTEELDDFMDHLSDYSGNKQFDDGWLILNAQGLSLNQILYYVNKGRPAALLLDDGRMLMISGYDNFNIRFYNPEQDNGETFLMGREDAEAYIAQHQNDFVVGIYRED